MSKKITKKEINQILKELGVDFKPKDGCLHVFLMKGGFFWDHEVTIKQGLYEYSYVNFYEVLLWYNYYICKRHRVHRFLFNDEEDYSKTSFYYTNRSYFSRTPKHYRNLSQKKGLKVIKQALEDFLIYHNGIPFYFNRKVFDNTSKIIE
ncbi:unnamed protein product [Cunninghamella blakesleeana]